MTDDGRQALEQRYADLVRGQLPAAARAGGWVLREDHCFGRVLAWRGKPPKRQRPTRA